VVFEYRPAVCRGSREAEASSRSAWPLLWRSVVSHRERNPRFEDHDAVDRSVGRVSIATVSSEREPLADSAARRSAKWMLRESTDGHRSRGVGYCRDSQTQVAAWRMLAPHGGWEGVGTRGRI
jgi:hypothetical protein